jgi:hypothetical protein
MSAWHETIESLLAGPLARVYSQRNEPLGMLIQPPGHQGALGFFFVQADEETVLRISTRHITSRQGDCLYIRVPATGIPVDWIMSADS